jgi:hypothetical protein
MVDFYDREPHQSLCSAIMGEVCVTDIFDNTVYIHSNEVTLDREPIYLCLDTK